MKLPQIAYPIYDVPLLSQKDPIKIRPFTVREEKLMLMAVSAGDLATTTDALKQIITNCVIGEFDVDNMSMIDMETIFLNLRARSIGERGVTHFKCLNKVVKKPKPVKVMANGVPVLVDAPPVDPDAPPEYVDCGMVFDIPIDFLNIPVLNKDINLQIKFTDDIGVRMKFPTFDLFRKLQSVPKEDVEIAMAASCLDVIYDKDSANPAKDATDQELKDFLLALPGDKYEKIREFISNVPQTRQESQIKCAKCGYEHKIVLEGIQDFFA